MCNASCENSFRYFTSSFAPGTRNARDGEPRSVDLAACCRHGAVLADDLGSARRAGSSVNFSRDPRHFARSFASLAGRGRFGFEWPLLSPSATSTRHPSCRPGGAPERCLHAIRSPQRGRPHSIHPSSSATQTGDLRQPPDPARRVRTVAPDRAGSRDLKNPQGGPIRRANRVAGVV